MRRIADGSVDLIAADLPYGATDCHWDTRLDLAELWGHYRRVLKPDGVVLLTAIQPFAAALITSNAAWFRFDTIWDKRTPSGFLNARKRPLLRHEHILLFSPARFGRFTYTPQMRTGRMKNKGRLSTSGVYGKSATPQRDSQCYGEVRPRQVRNDQYFPTSIVEFSNGNGNGKLHSTQKPLALFEYLIRTYSRQGELVLDNCCGSGTTLIAALNTGRRAIGIEKDPAIHAVARKRLSAAFAAAA